MRPTVMILAAFTALAGVSAGIAASAIDRPAAELRMLKLKDSRPWTRTRARGTRWTDELREDDLPTGGGRLRTEPQAELFAGPA